MPLLWVPLQYPREACTLEPRGSKVAGAPPIAEGVGESADTSFETCGGDFKQAGIRCNVDHIVPARLIRRLRAGNPDRRENLQCICGPCPPWQRPSAPKLGLG